MSLPVESVISLAIFHSPIEGSIKKSHPSSHITIGESSKKLKGKLCETILDFGGYFSKLQEEVVLDIFSRLPLNDLRQCRCVRKSWYQSIPSPCFVKLHHEKSTFRRPYFVSYILQEFNDTTEDETYQLYLLEFSYSTVSHEYAFGITPLRTPLDEMELSYYLVGSCNGLLCLCDTDHFDPVYICNPIIGEYITLPAWNCPTEGSIIAGFGFDQKTGDYKVIRMACLPAMLIDGEIHRDVLAEVYTLGSKNWRKIGVVPFAPRGDRHGVILNGIIHWIGETCGILCFDINSEYFSLLKLPTGYYDGEIDVNNLEIRVIKGQLCICDEIRCRRPIVWTMKEYGDEKSWVRERREYFACLQAEFNLVLVYGILENFQSICNIMPFAVSFVSRIDPKDEASSEGCLKLGNWSKRLYQILSGPHPNAADIGAIGEVDDSDEEHPQITSTKNYDIFMMLLSW